MTVFLVFLAAFLAHSALAAFDPGQLQLLGPQAVNLWKLDNLHTQPEEFGVITHSEAQQPVQTPLFHARWFEQPVDHFNKTAGTWRQRYWVNDRHYKPKSEKTVPVIVIDGGETSGEDRLPFLDTGIAEILAKATGGIGVVLEHRYYGKSLPVANLTTDSLRFLNNAQSAADSANFMANVKFVGVREDLTAPHTPWIYYGGSYAGARAAHMRVLYPDLVYGAIASSAVTHATIENWEYMEIIRNAAEPKCAAHLEKSIKTIDGILFHAPAPARRRLRGLFGVADLSHDEDFVSLIESPLGSWQAKNWDPSVGSSRWEEFCNTLDLPIFGRMEDVTSQLASSTIWSYDDEDDVLILEESEEGANDRLIIDLSVLNYAKYIREKYVSRCPIDEGATIEQCFGTYDDTQFQGISLEEEWRLWLFQVCTEWGYFSTAPPSGHPRIVSKLLNLDYESKICRQAFLPGKHFSVPNLPNVTVVNELGDFDIEAERLAIIDGDVDPWRPCTPHSDYARERKDTISKPYKLIPGGVHHYDENGLRRRDDEPAHIQKIHKEIVEFVTAWLHDWKPPKKGKGKAD